MLRDLKELRWRRKGPPLPASVLDAAKHKINPPQGEWRWELPKAYCSFLSQMDGGRPGRGAFQAGGKTWTIEGFYAFADAANVAEKLRRSGRLPDGILPVAFTANDKPLVYLELTGAGKVFLKGSPRARFEDAKAVHELSPDFARFLDLLGDEADAGGAGAVAAAADPWGTRAAAAPAASPVKKATNNKPAGVKAAAAKKATKKKTAKKATKKKTAKKVAKKKTAKKVAKKKTAKKAAKKKTAKKAAKKKTAKKAAKKKIAKKRR